MKKIKRFLFLLTIVSSFAAYAEVPSIYEYSGIHPTSEKSAVNAAVNTAEFYCWLDGNTNCSVKSAKGTGCDRDYGVCTGEAIVWGTGNVGVDIGISIVQVESRNLAGCQSKLIAEMKYVCADDGISDCLLKFVGYDEQFPYAEKRYYICTGVFYHKS